MEASVRNRRGFTEGLQEIVSNAAATVYDENRDLFAGVPESAFFGSLVGGGVSVGMDITNKGLSDMKQGKFGLSIEDVSKQDTPKIDFNKYKKKYHHRLL